MISISRSSSETSAGSLSDISQLTRFTVRAFDHTADQGGGVFSQTRDTGIAFDDSLRVIARGKDRSCSADFLPGMAAVATADGWRRNLALDVTCQTGQGYLDGALFDGSVLTLDVPRHAAYGFKAGAAAFVSGVAKDAFSLWLNQHTQEAEQLAAAKPQESAARDADGRRARQAGCSGGRDGATHLDVRPHPCVACR